jgi:hypothetical protein
MPSAKTLSISRAQLNTLRVMLNALSGRSFDDTSIDQELLLLTKRQGVLLVRVVGQMLRIRGALRSKGTMTCLQPLLNHLGITVSLAVH